jgi:hypothetical protein
VGDFQKFAEIKYKAWSSQQVFSWLKPMFACHEANFLEEAQPEFFQHEVFTQEEPTQSGPGLTKRKLPDSKLRSSHDDFLWRETILNPGF